MADRLTFDVRVVPPPGLSFGEKEFVRSHSDLRVSPEGLDGPVLVVRALELDGITLVGISATTGGHSLAKHKSITVVHRHFRSVGIGRALLKIKAAVYRLIYLRDLKSTVHPTNEASLAMCRAAGVSILSSEVPNGTDQGSV